MAKKKEQLVMFPPTVPVPVHKQVLLWHLPRNEEIVGPEPSSELIQSIRTYGVIQPIVLLEYPYKEGSLIPHYELIAGRRRLKAMRIVSGEDTGRVMNTTIPAMIYLESMLGSPSEVLSIVENSVRSENPISDLEAIETLLAKGATRQQIRDATGMSLQTIESRMRLSALPKNIRQLTALGKIAISTAEAVVRLSPDLRMEAERLSKEQDGRLTPKQVSDLRRAKATTAVQSMPADMFDVAEQVPAHELLARRVLALAEDIKQLPEDVYGHVIEACGYCTPLVIALRHYDPKDLLTTNTTDDNKSKKTKGRKARA